MILLRSAKSLPYNRSLPSESKVVIQQRDYSTLATISTCAKSQQLVFGNLTSTPQRISSISDSVLAEFGDPVAVCHTEIKERMEGRYTGVENKLGVDKWTGSRARVWEGEAERVGSGDSRAQAPSPENFSESIHEET